MNAVGAMLGTAICARLSDIYGRKWLTLVGVAANAIFAGLFGFSATYWQLLITRFLSGLAGGAQGATARVICSELTDSSNQAMAFTLLGTGWQVGATIAPSLGAALAAPAESWSFFKNTVFETFPYALPGVLTGTFLLFVVMLAAIYAKETHPDYKDGKKRPSFKLKRSDYQSLASGTTERNLLESCKIFLLGDNTGLPSLWSCGEGFMLLIWVGDDPQIAATS